MFGSREIEFETCSEITGREREREREREIELEPCSEIRERERLNWGLAQKSQLRLTWNDDELNQDE